MCRATSRGHHGAFEGTRALPRDQDKKGPGTRMLLVSGLCNNDHSTRQRGEAAGMMRARGGAIALVIALGVAALPAGGGGDPARATTGPRPGKARGGGEPVP